MIDAEGKLFAWQKQAELGRKLNKERFYAGVRNNRKLKELFTEQVARVTWRYKLASNTLNIPATAEVPEIEVIQIDVSGSELDPAVLIAIDKAIPNPTIHEIHCGSKVQQTAAFKRASEADSKGWVISHYITSPLQPSDVVRQSLPQSLNLGILYASLLRSMIDVPALDGESLRAHVERHGEILALRREAERVAKKMNTEKQLNRKVELNSRLRDINQTIFRQINGLSTEH
jgi:hypothetical protein